MLFDHGRMLDMVVVEGERLMAGAHDASPDSPVAGASGRTLHETLRHLDGEYRQALEWLRAARPRDRSDRLGRSGGLGADGTGAPPDRHADAGTCREPACDTGAKATVDVARTSRGLAGTMAALLAELGTRAPDERCATWWSQDHTVGFWQRRIVHETTVHRVDVQSASGVPPTSVDPEVALDGVDEALRLWFGYRLRALGITARYPCTVEVNTGGMSWHAVAHSDGDLTGRQVPPTEVDIPRQRSCNGESDWGVDAESPRSVPEVSAWIHGDPSSVYLWLWGRLPDRAITTCGDTDAIAQLWGLLRLAMH